MEGDPVIRRQTMRDLLDVPENEWRAERERTAVCGWGAAFLAAMTPDGSWPDGRWTGTVWTLLSVIDCGLPADHPKLRQAALGFLNSNLTARRLASSHELLGGTDLCHLGFWLRIGAYFLGNDPRLKFLAETILSTQLSDGGFNCRIRTESKVIHSSFHTTFNVLEGLREAADAGIVAPDVFRQTERRALEFMLAHKLYRSDKTGEVVSERFLHPTYPSHWHYTVLRGLDYIRNCPEIADERLADPISAMVARRTPNGRWPVEKRIPGLTHFDMERFGGESRWNTLRMMRVLRQREMADKAQID